LGGGLKMQDVKMTDRKAGRELAGLETAGCEMRDRAGTIEYDSEHYYYSTTLHPWLIVCWHCPHSMQNRVCVSVRACVHQSHLAAAAAGLLLWAQPAGDLD